MDNQPEIYGTQLLVDLSRSQTSNASARSASCDRCADRAWRFQELESKISPCRAFLVAIDVAFDVKRR